MDTSLREANAEIQSGSYFGRFERPSDIDRMVVDSGVCFFQIAFLMAKEEISPKETAPVRKVVQGFYHGPPGEGLGVYCPMR